MCVCSFPLLLSQRFAGTRFEEQRQLHMPQKHKATEQERSRKVMGGFSLRKCQKRPTVRAKETYYVLSFESGAERGCLSDPLPLACVLCEEEET